MTSAEYKHKWYIQNRERLIAKAILRQRAHATEIRESRRTPEFRKRVNKKNFIRRNTPQGSVYYAGLSALNELLDGRRKTSKWLIPLGCSLASWRKHLETQFEPWMTWNNHGAGKGFWQIDHIKPASKFNLADPKQLKKFFHFTNTRPLCAVKNASQGSGRPRCP